MLKKPVQKEGHIELQKCVYGHDNPALRAFLVKYSKNKVPNGLTLTHAKDV